MLFISKFFYKFQSRHQLDAALEKIFHPEKFDLKRLNRDGEGYVDERSRQFSTAGASLDPRAQMFYGGSEAEDEAEEDNDKRKEVVFKKQKSVVLVDSSSSSIPEQPPPTSIRKNHSQASFQTYMRAVSGKRSTKSNKNLDCNLVIRNHFLFALHMQL